MYVLSIVNQLKFSYIHHLYENLTSTLEANITERKHAALLYEITEHRKILEEYDKKRTGHTKPKPQRAAKKLHKHISNFRLKFNPMGPDQRKINDMLRQLQNTLLKYLN